MSLERQAEALREAQKFAQQTLTKPSAKKEIMKTYYAIFYIQNGLIQNCPSWNTHLKLDNIWDSFTDKKVALKYYKELVDQYGSNRVIFAEINGDIRQEYENEKQFKIKQLNYMINMKKKDIETLELQIKDLQRERD